MLSEVDTLTARLAAQDQLITREQAWAAGLTRAGLRWRLERGRWRELLPGIYLAVTGPTTPRQRAYAALLYGGPSSQLTGVAALKLHGLRYLPTDPYLRVLVPRRQQRRSVGFVRLHRTDRLDPAPHTYPPLRLTSAARAVVEAGRRCGDERAVRAMVADAIQRRLATVAQLRAELAAASRNGCGGLRLAVAEVADGVRSVAEGDLRTLLAGSRVLPPIQWNPHLVSVDDGRTLPTPDGWIAEVGLALEVDSREHHSTAAGWERTLTRHNTLARYGAQVLHLVPSQLRREPAGVLAVVEKTYLARRRAGQRAAIVVAPELPSP